MCELINVSKSGYKWGLVKPGLNENNFFGGGITYFTEVILEAVGREEAIFLLRSAYDATSDRRRITYFIGVNLESAGREEVRFLLRSAAHATSTAEETYFTRVSLEAAGREE